MKQYLSFLKNILENGKEKTDRTGVGTLSIFGYQMRFNLSEGFPLVTTKKLHTKSIIHELLWFLSGDTNIKYLNENGVRIWNEWADNNGDLGPIYGYQWRNWSSGENKKSIDQISNLIYEIKNNKNSRRLILSSWNVSDIDKMALPPCHLLSQFYVINNEISCQLYQRSADAFLGVPFNIASYSLLLHMIAQQCCLNVGSFIWTGGDCHIYSNHIDQVKTQISRAPFDKPKLIIKTKPNSIFCYKYEDFEFIDYICHPGIKGKIAI